MKLSHLALTAIEGPDHNGQSHWLLLESTGELDELKEFEASKDSFETAQAAFEAGAIRWNLARREEDEDADLIDDAVPARNNSPPAESPDRQREDMTRDIVIDALRMAWFKRHPGNSRSAL
jgi:hypothetical protein